MKQYKDKYNEKFVKFRKGKIENFSPTINRAYKLAAYAHRNQKRKSGDDYMTHPVSIMNYLRSINVEKDILIASLLHDVIEDSAVTIKDIHDLFNGEIASIVYFLSKDKLSCFKDKDQRRLVYFHKLEVGFCFNYKIYLIKLTDRLHNISTLSSLSTQKRIDTMKETMTVMIPLFKKYLYVVPKKHQKACQIMISDIEDVMKDFFLE